MAKLTRTLGEIIPPHLVFGTDKHAAEEDEGGEEYKFEEEDVLAPTPLSATMPKMRQRRSMSVDFAQDTAPLMPRSSRVWVTGNKTWRGEWNRKDIREVQKQLRSLKAR